MIHHGNKPNSDLQEKQSQSDVLSLLKRYLRALSVPVSFEKVEAHVDDHRPARFRTREENWNVDMDRLAKFALLNAIETRSFIGPYFPFETFRCHTGFGKISGSPTQAIYDWFGYTTAKKLFDVRGIVSSNMFDLIFWEGMKKAVSNFPPTFNSWIAKHVSHFCGTNRQLSRIDSSVKNICPSCGQENESTSHITRCPDPGRIASLEAAVDDLCDWMDDKETDPYLQHIIVEYLLGRGIIDMADIIDPEPRFIEFAEIHDNLGWDNFVEGRISKSLVHLQRQYLSTISTYTKINTWASGLMRQLLILTHQQWVYRNCTVHFKRDGRTLPQHKDILRKVNFLLHTNEDMLLPADRDLLHIDAAQLGKGPAIVQDRWIANMNSAISAGRIHRARRRSRVRLPRICRRRNVVQTEPQSMESDSEDSDYETEEEEEDEELCVPPPVLRTRDYITSYFAPARDTEGSLRFRRRRKK